jgi:hypothetical protein
MAKATRTSPIISKGSEKKHSTPQTSAQSRIRPEATIAAKTQPAPPKRTPATPPWPRNANPNSQTRK